MSDETIGNFDREAAYRLVTFFDDAMMRWDVPQMKRAVTAMDQYARTFFGTQVVQDINARTGMGTIPLGRGMAFRFHFAKLLEESYGARQNAPGTSFRPRD